MSISISILVDNTAKEHYLSEWGFCALIETGAERILFDTGRTASALYNAKLMGKGLSKLTAIILNHGHADHTGGLSPILKQAEATTIVSHPAAFNPKYARREPDKPPEYIGFPMSQGEIEKAGAKLVLTRQPYRISECIMTTGEIPLANDFEKPGKGLLEIRNGTLVPDDVADDTALVIKSSEGIVVITGCAHRGIINTLEAALNVSGEKNILAVVGGFHLYNADPEQIAETAVHLEQTGLKNIFAGHCTGSEAGNYLARKLGDSYRPMAAGMTIEL